MPPEGSDPRSDLELVADANRGDESAMAALYMRHRDWVVRLATRFTGQHADAMDVLQETFAYLFRKFPGFQLTASMTTFLYPVVRNLALAVRRKRRGQPLTSEVADSLAAAAPDAAGDLRAELASVVASLPEGQAEVLLMRFVDGMSLAEIAAALSLPLGTVKSRLHHALAALRDDPRTRAYFEEK